MDDGDDSDGEEAERRKIVGLCRGVDCKYKTLNIVRGRYVYLYLYSCDHALSGSILDIIYIFTLGDSPASSYWVEDHELWQDLLWGKGAFLFSINLIFI